jgi:hypothetical protein
MEIAHRTSRISKSVRRNGKVVERTLYTYHNGLHQDIQDFLATLSFDNRVRVNGYGLNTTTTVFFKDAELVDKITNKYGNSVLSLERPKDDAHLHAVSSQKFIARKTLFYGVYRHRFTLNPRKASSRDSSWNWQTRSYTKPETLAKWNEMDAWILDYMKRMKRNDAEYFLINRTSWEPIIFFTNDADASMFKLTWGEYLKDSLRVKLHDEL